MAAYEVEIVIPHDCGLPEAGETLTIMVEDSEYILAAARQEGIWLPADCQQGWCTTCAAKLLDGSVDQSDAKRYFAVDEDAALILPCTARPQSDMTIRVCQHETMLDHRANHDLPPGSSKR